MPVTRGLGVLLVGPPGSGRRTQGYRLSETLGVCNINVSALVHAAMKAKHPHVMHVLSSGEKLSDVSELDQYRV
jgi:adenylate kinase family enzyme